MKFSVQFSENDLYLCFMCVISVIIFVVMGSSFGVSVVSGAFLFLYFKFLHGVFIIIQKVVKSFVGKPIDRTAPDQKDHKEVSTDK